MTILRGFSPDGSNIASTSYDNTVRLWDGVTGASITSLGHSGYISAIAFSPDGSKIASTSYDNVQLWDSATGASIACLEGHSYDVSHVAFSPDGSKIASASNDNTVRLWDGITGAFIASLEGHSSLICALIFSPVSTSLSHDDTVRLWDSATGEPISNEDDAFQLSASLGHPLSLSIKKDSSSSRVHITGSRLGNIDPARTVPLCWLSHDINFTTAFAYTASHAALGSENGWVMLFDMRNVQLE